MSESSRMALRAGCAHALRMLTIPGVLLVWEILARVFYTKRAELLYGSPSAIATYLFDRVRDSSLATDLYASMWTVLPALVAGTLCGLFATLLLAVYAPRWRYVVLVVAVIFFAIPAFVPFYILRLWDPGFSAAPKWITAFYLAFIDQFIVLSFIVSGWFVGKGASADVAQLITARSLGATRWQLLRNHLLYMANALSLRGFVIGARSTIGILFVLETYATSRGIGFRINADEQLANATWLLGDVLVMACWVLLTILAGYVVYALVTFIPPSFMRFLHTNTCGNPSSTGVLELEHVSHVYLKKDGLLTWRLVHALQDVSLRVEQGKIVAIVGRSGCGKSTLLNLIAGGIPAPTKGRIVLGGKLLNGAPLGSRGVGFLLQYNMLYQAFSVLTNIMLGPFYAGMNKKNAKTEALRYISALDLQNIATSRGNMLEISGGEARRANLARLLAAHPGLLLLDEPFTGLDRELSDQAINIVVQILRKEKKTALWVTHDLTEALLFADRIVVMREGRIEQVGSPDDIKARPATPYVKHLVDLVQARQRAVAP